MAQEFKAALKDKQVKRRNRQNKWSSEGLSRRSKRDKKAPDKFEIKSTKGKSYDT